MMTEDKEIRKIVNGNIQRKWHSFKLKWTQSPSEPPKTGSAMTSAASSRKRPDKTSSHR